MFKYYVNAIINIIFKILTVSIRLYAWKLFDITCSNDNFIRILQGKLPYRVQYER